MKDPHNYRYKIYQALENQVRVLRVNNSLNSDLEFPVDSRVENLTSKEFRGYYRKKKMKGVSTKTAYQLLTRKPYENRFKYLKSLLILGSSNIVAYTMNKILTKSVRSGIASGLIKAGIIGAILYLFSKYT